MKQIILSITLILGLSMIGFSQDPESNPKIQAARIALITERLNLTPEQAEKFWPIYKEYNVKRREIQQQFRQQLGNVDPKNVTDEQAKQMVQYQLERKQQQLNLEKQYSQRILEVISSKQLVSLKKAEDDFKRMLLEKIRQRQQMQRDRQQRMQQLNQRKNN